MTLPPDEGGEGMLGWASADCLVGPTCDQAPLASEPFHVNRLPDGTLWAEFYRVPAGYLIRFPRLADFMVPSDGSTILIYPVPGISASTVEHLYLNQVWPLAQSRAGKTVAHASAVEIGDGAIAFLAETRARQVNACGSLFCPRKPVSY